MWTVSLKAAQSELIESAGRPYGRRNSTWTAVRPAATNYVNLYIDYTSFSIYVFHFIIMFIYNVSASHPPQAVFPSVYGQTKLHFIIIFIV